MGSELIFWDGFLLRRFGNYWEDRVWGLWCFILSKTT